MANEQNLKMGGEAHKLTVEEASRGGKASGEARRKKKLMREAFDELLSREYHDREGKVLDGTSALAAKVFKQAMDGDLKAFEIIRDTTGQAAPKKVIMAEIDQATIDEVERMVLGSE